MLFIDAFILLLIGIKFVYVVTTLGPWLHSKITTNTNTDTDKNITKKSKIKQVNKVSELLFIIGMSILLIYHFNPHAYQPFSKHALTLFYVFGVLLFVQYIQILYHYIG